MERGPWALAHESRARARDPSLSSWPGRLALASSSFTSPRSPRHVRDLCCSIRVRGVRPRESSDPVPDRSDQGQDHSDPVPDRSDLGQDHSVLGQDRSDLGQDHSDPVPDHSVLGPDRSDPEGPHGVCVPERGSWAPSPWPLPRMPIPGARKGERHGRGWKNRGRGGEWLRRMEERRRRPEHDARPTSVGRGWVGGAGASGTDGTTRGRGWTMSLSMVKTRVGGVDGRAWAWAIRGGDPRARGSRASDPGGACQDRDARARAAGADPEPRSSGDHDGHPS